MSRAMTAADAKAMISSFRVSELQMFLGYVGINKLGRKDDLVARACQVVDSRNFNDSLKAKIRELYDIVTSSALGPGQLHMAPANGMQNRPMNAPMMGMQPGVPQLRQSSLGASALQLRQERQGVVPLQAVPQIQASQVAMTEHPFYELLDVVHGPTILTPNNSTVKIQETRVQFVLKPEQINQITHVRDIRPGVNVDYPVQLQLRFCQANAPMPQPDLFPGSLNAKLNAKPLPLPPAIPSNRQGVESKRPPKPVDITKLAKFSPVVANYLDISWGLDLGKAYAFQLNLVRKLLPDELLKVVRSRPLIPKEVTKSRIREILDEDSDIATESLRLSLRCPLGKMRMALPCRAIPTCHPHVQCFDATMFLHMNEKKASWVCPVCMKPANFKELAIDEYFSEVLASDLTKDCDEVELNIDGTFFPIVVDEEGKKEVKRVKADTKTEVKPAGAADVKPAVNTSIADANGRESPPLVTLSDDENQENANPDVVPSGQNPPPPPPPAEEPPAQAPQPPPPPSPPGSPEVLTIDDD